MSSSALEASGLSPANRPPPQMALATAHPESATKAKETVSRPESPRHGLTQFPTLPRGCAPGSPQRRRCAAHPCAFSANCSTAVRHNIRRWARLLCRLEVTKVQVPTLYLGNLDKARPCATLELGAVRPWLTRRGTCPDAPKLG